MPLGPYIFYIHIYLSIIYCVELLTLIRLCQRFEGGECFLIHCKIPRCQNLIFLKIQASFCCLTLIYSFIVCRTYVLIYNVQLNGRLYILEPIITISYYFCSLICILFLLRKDENKVGIYLEEISHKEDRIRKKMYILIGLVRIQIRPLIKEDSPSCLIIYCSASTRSFKYFFLNEDSFLLHRYFHLFIQLMLFFCFCNEYFQS